ncbi:MAG: transcriptional regulator [Magnetovibrio sp.]|nr:transcriptional regulator [Magnetovibrio sp.]
MNKLMGVLLWVGLGVPFGPLNAAELVYFGSAACPICDTWEHEVGEIYPKTDESKVLPLRHHDVHDDRPDDLAFIKGVVFTPTFVAIEEGREVGRIIGYMGDFFFWEQVGGLIKKLKASQAQRQTACSQIGTESSAAQC